MSDMQASRNSSLSIVVGLGEVGKPLLEVLSATHRVEGIDLPPRDVEGAVEFMHVCYPAEIEDFVGITREYANRYDPDVIVIHSTVPLGTTMAVERATERPTVHSPVRGKHVRMASELRSYAKFIGSRDTAAARRTESHFCEAGMTVRCLSSPEATELAKLTETTYFGVLIAFAQDVARMAAAQNVSYDEVAAFYEEIGYLPRVKFFPGKIGGHCVMPNIALLKRTFSSRLLDAVQWSNALREQQG